MSLRGVRQTTPERQLIWDGLGLGKSYSGVGHYGHRLHAALIELGVSPVVTCADEPPEFIKDHSWISLNESSSIKSALNFLPRKFCELKPIFSNLSYQLSKEKFDAVIYHGLSNLNLPQFTSRRSTDRFVVTIHDIIPMITSRWSVLAMQMRMLMPSVIQVADAIIVPSSWTKDCLIDFFGDGCRQKITVIPNGTEKFDSLNSRDHEDTEKELNDVLSVARGEQYKRLNIVSDMAKMMTDVKFTVVTDKSGLKFLGELPPNLRVFTNINGFDLRRLYNCSRVFLHPSLYEGWCLPAADAVTAGLIVVYVRGTGIDDVCAHAPKSVFGLDADSPLEAWINATRAAINKSKDIPTREPAADMPTWADNAEKTLKIYQSLL